MNKKVSHLGKPRGGALINKLKTHCKNGHAYDKENTIIMRHGARGCRLCRKANNIRSHEKRRLKTQSP